MSYKKIVAGVATFAIASAMVVPAAFATEATTQPAPDQTPTSTVMPQSGVMEVHAPKLPVANYPGITVVAEGTDSYTVTDCGGTHKFNLEEFTEYLQRVKEFEGKRKDAVKKAEELLKCLAKFNDRTLEVKVGDYVFNNANVVVSLKAQLEKVKGMTYCQHNMRELDMAIKWLNEQEKYVNAFLKMDPAALEKACKKGCSDKKAAGKAAASSAAKGGKHLPKTADAAPVAPIAAVAGSAALIAAGLVASRKVNA